MRRFVCPITKVPLCWLNVNEYAVTDSSETIKTVLGSCVAIILWDTEQGLFAVNHFLNAQHGKPLSEKMLSDLKQKGGNSFSAIISGGAKQQESTFAIGEENIKFAQAFLKEQGIRLLQESTGGDKGRTISVSYNNGSISFESSGHKDGADAGKSTKSTVRPLRKKNVPEKPGAKSTRTPRTEMKDASTEAYKFLQELMKKSEDRNK